jgi:hypothetical protein
MVKNNNYIIFVVLIILIIFGICSSMKDDPDKEEKANIPPQKNNKANIPPQKNNKAIITPDIEFIGGVNNHQKFPEDSFELIKSYDDNLLLEGNFLNQADNSMEIIVN